MRALKCKVAIVGHFAKDKAFADGQTVKTRNLYRVLCEEYGEENIFLVDTYGFKKHIISFVLKCLGAFKKAENIIILPAHNGVRVFVPLFDFFNIFFKRKLHYDVIGGWLPYFLKKHTVLVKPLKKFNGIYVETENMKSALKEQGFKNVYVIPNFKYLEVLKEDNISLDYLKPYRLCTFSRVMEEKGIEDAISVVKEINKEKGETVYTLDIYGQIDSGYKERFAEKEKEFPDFIKYKGVISPEESVQILKDYFALLFPTKFYTEGVPGTLIDAYAAGVPVITALWANHKDVFKEGITGWGYEFKNTDDFKKLLKKAAEDPNEFLKMKKTALKEAEGYTPAVAMAKLKKRID